MKYLVHFTRVSRGANIVEASSEEEARKKVGPPWDWEHSSIDFDFIHLAPYCLVLPSPDSRNLRNPKVEYEALMIVYKDSSDPKRPFSCIKNTVSTRKTTNVDEIVNIEGLQMLQVGPDGLEDYNETI